MILLVQKLMKQLKSETPRGSRHTKFPFSILWFLSFSTFSCVQFPPLLFASFFVLLSFSEPPSPIPPASPITSSADCIPPLSLFIFLIVSARAFQVPEIFIFNCFLLFCLSACHCLCLLQPPPVGEFLSLFSVLTNHCPWRHFSFFFFLFLIQSKAKYEQSVREVI